MKNFGSRVENGQGGTETDYVLGWYSEYAGPDRITPYGSCNFWFRGGAGPEPCSFVTSVGDSPDSHQIQPSLKNYRLSRTVWLADAYKVPGWEVYWGEHHNEVKYHNVSRIDGSSVTLNNIQRPGSFVQNFYWNADNPIGHNMRPGYGYWWWVEEEAGQ